MPRFLLVSVIPASLIILSLCAIGPQAEAAALQDGAATTIDGTIHKIMQVDAGFEFYIEDDSLNGSRVYISSQEEQSCRLFSHIHATGKLSRPVSGTDHVDWHLTDATFSCQ